MRHVIGSVEEFPVGSRRIVAVGRRSIGVFRTPERFYALRNRCPHQGGPLCEGPVQPLVESSLPGEATLRDGRWLVACPWHNWEYDLATGASWFDPDGNRVRAYDVIVAETYDVDVVGGQVVLIA